jgi:hypothetical protein
MTPASDHQSASTTSTPPVRPWIARWRPRVPWIVCGLCLIVILGMGGVMYQLWSQITAYQRDQENVRSMATTSLQLAINDVRLHLIHAQIASEHNEIDTMVDQLNLALLAIYDAEASKELYGVVLFHDQPGRHVELGFEGYASAIEDLGFAIDQRNAILPADRDHLSIIQADFELMRDIFPADLLRDGRAEDLVTAQTTFCLENHMHAMLYGDAQPREEYCRALAER